MESPLKGGRPTERTPEIDVKIEQVASYGASNEEIAFFIGVHRRTLQTWLENDPELRHRIEELKEKPILKARETIVQSLNDPDNAKWYLARKKKREFAERTETDITTNDKDIAPDVDIVKLANEVVQKLKEAKTQ
jgi:hypothetical protein